MFTMILISSVAVLVGILGSALIWRLDASRADEIEHATVPVVDRPGLEPAPRSRPAIM